MLHIIRTSHDAVCVTPAGPLIPFSLFNSVLSLVRFRQFSSLLVIDATPAADSIGLVFAQNGGTAVSPAAPAAHAAIFHAVSKNMQLPGTAGSVYIWVLVITGNCTRLFDLYPLVTDRQGRCLLAYICR